MKHRFICNECGESIMMNINAVCCPYCGSKSITSSAIETALSNLDFMQNIIPELKDAEQNYLRLWCEYEIARQRAVAHARRGIINSKQIPKYERVSMETALKNYRKERKSK